MREAVREASKYGKVAIVDSFVRDNDHRILVVDGKMIAAAKCIPGHVVGDGGSSVAEFVEETKKDPRREKGFEKVMVVFEFDAQAKRVLSEQGLTWDSVPTVGQTVIMRGTAVDVTDIIHPDNARVAVRAARAFGLHVAGVNFPSTDINRSYNENGGAICEINASPGLWPHWLGDAKRDVVGPILESLYPPGASSRVPIAAITWTDGKTTTSRMVARILEHAGHVVGLAGTDGVYINGDLVVDDDMAGRLGANLVLRSPEIDSAVLETARRGIISGGLGFDWCDVGAVLNIGDDHIGTDGVRDIAHLASIKGLVVQAARRTAVLNGDDQHCVAMAERAGAARVCYVTMAPDHGLVADDIAAGGMAVTLRPDDGGPVIELRENGAVVDIMPAYDAPTALDGRAMHNIQNAMFAAAIAHGLGKSLENFRSGLKLLGVVRADTSARLEIFDRFSFIVILDHAHNPREFDAVSKTLMQMECAGRRIVAFTAALEIDAVKAALDMARPGDLVTLLYTSHNRTWDLLTETTGT